MRSKWEFDCSAEQLAQGCRHKLAHHNQRLVWWEAKRSEIKAKIQESGIEIHETVAMSYGKTGMGGPSVEINEELAKNLNECTTSIFSHRTKVNEFEGWLQVFEANIKLSFKLDHEDWLYFFGKN